MRHIRSRLSIVLIGSSLALHAQGSEPAAVQASAQDGPKEARERALSKTRTQLEARPTHAQVFDHYFKLVVESNALESEVKLWESKLAKEAGEQTSSIILGKLLLRTGKEERALEVLDGIATKTPEIQGVLGEIYQKLARHDQASRAYEAALPSAVTSEAKRVLYEKIGKCHLALGKKAQAMATWEKIGELDGGKFHRRLRVAELLVEAGLLPEAEKAYEPLLGETSDDPAQLCRVMRDQGRLQELQGKLEKALATYEEILQKTARGNWLRKEIEGRVVQIHRRTGKLDALLARLETQRKEQPDDLGTAELLSDVYVETRKPEQAIVVLAATTPRFPNDAKLARRLAQLYVERNQLDEAIAEYQRILTAKPDELELYLELGQLFAKGDKFKEAKNQWEKVLAKNLKDAGLCARIASMYALYEREEDAVRLYERAIEIEPESMQRYTDLSEYLFARNQGERAKAVLSRALQVAEGKPRRLEALAGTLREHDLVEEAKRCLEAILKVEPNNQEQRYALADLLLSQKQQEAAKALLWQVLEADDKGGGGQRTQAANTLVQLAFQVNGQAGLEAEASAKASAGAAFLLGRLHSRGRDFEKAIASFRVALERKADDIEARRLLARLLSDEGDFAAALAEYAKVEHLQPGEGKRLFREVARLHLETYELEKAIEVWQKAMRDNPDNASVFVEVGKEFLSIQRVPEALEAFQQAARLKANDPDIQLRLADALKQAGKPEDAEKLLLEVAQKALDARDREQARNKLFELVAEQGLIDKRIESLTGTVSENPYDKDAPQLLADLYMRTGDYVLGLEMVERAVNFQPKNKELLTRRAELLEALEEWDKAKAAHEELLKFPDAERDVHLAGIGQALYEAGKATEAKAVFEKIQDRGRVAALYKKYELREEAIEYYKRAIRKNPGDLRSYVDLAEQLVERNKQVEAIEVLERGLNLNASHRKSLELLGKLYVQNDRRQDAVKCGMRLFGLRGEEVEKTRREEYEEQQGSGGRFAGPAFQRPFNTLRLNAAQSFFEQRGLQGEWGAILVAEALRRPTDTVLLNAVQTHYGWADKSPQKLIAFLRELLARDFSKVRVPPDRTPRSYQAQLESMLLTVYRQDASSAEHRITQLGANALSADGLTERARLLVGLGRIEPAVVDLRAALAVDPSHAIARVSLANLLIDRKEHAEAAKVLGEHAAWWSSERGVAATREREARAALDFVMGRKSFVDRFPRKLRRRVDDAFMSQVRKETEAASDGSWRSPATVRFHEETPPRFATLLKQLRTLRAAGDSAGFAATLELAKSEANTLARRTQLGGVLHEEGAKEASEELLRAVLAEEPRVKSDPLRAYCWQSYVPHFNSAALALGKQLSEQGRGLEAYRVLRDHGQAQQAELVLRKQVKLEEVRAMLGENLARAETALREARSKSAGEIVGLELDYRDELVKLADFQLGEKEFAKVDELYTASLELLPDDLEIREVLAALRLRQGDTDRAIAMHEEIIDVKRRKRRAQQVDAALPPMRLRPSLPDATTTDPRLAGPSLASGRSRPGVSASLEVSDSFLQILSIHRGRNDAAGVLDILRRIQREDPSSYRNMAYSVVSIVRDLDLGKNRLPILRALRSAVSSDDWLSVEFAKACLEANDLQEAKRCLEKFLAASTRGSGGYYQEEADRLITKIGQRLGETKLTLADLEKRSAAEPDNVRHRMMLADRLMKERKYERALAEAELVTRSAPYLAKAKELTINAACAMGADERARELLQKLFADSTKPAEKIRRGVAYANWLFVEGKREEAFAIVEGLEVEAGGTSSNQFSAGNWFLDRHELGRAAKCLEREVEKNKSQSWIVDSLRPRLARVEIASGAIDAAVARHLESIRAAASLADREARFKELLNTLTGHPRPRFYAEKLERHAARKSLDDLLVMIALDFATDDAKAAMADIRRALELSNKELYLYPLLYGLHKWSGDLEGALTVLDRLATVYGGSDAMRYTGALATSERDLFKLERASVLQDLGRGAEADALIESLFDATKVDSMLTVANVFKEQRRFDKALEWRKKWSDKTGQRTAAALCDDAEILAELGKLDDALALLAEADLMSRGEARVRKLQVDLHRKRGTLPELVARLEEDHRKDPRNAAVRAQLLPLYEELRMRDKIRAIHEKSSEDPTTRFESLQALADFAQQEGDTTLAVKCHEAAIALKGGEEKKRLQVNLATVLTAAGEIDRAEALLRQAYDLETTQGCEQMASWLTSQERDDGARALYTKVRELDPDATSWRSFFTVDARKHGRFAEYLQLVFESARKAPTGFQYLQRTAIVDALSGLTEAERTKLLAPSDDLDELERAGVLHALLGDVARAKPLLENVLAKDSNRALALEHLRRIAANQGALSDELALTQRLHAAIERAFVVRSDWSVQSTAGQLWRAIGQLHFRLGNEAAANEVWRTPALRRSPFVASGSSYRYDYSMPYASDAWAELGEPVRALAAFDREFLMREQAPWPQYWRRLAEAGRREEAEKAAWQRLLDPLRLYGARDRAVGWTWDAETGNSEPTDESIEFLLESYRERGALEALQAELERLVQRPESRFQAEEFRTAIVRRIGDWKTRAAAMERALEEQAESGNLRMATARAWARAGDADKILFHLGKVFDLASPGLRLPAGREAKESYRVVEYVGGQRIRTAGPKNPFSFSFQNGGRTSTSYSSYSWETLEQHRVAAYPLLILAGKRDVATALEKDLLERARAPGARSGVHSGLGDACLAIDLHAEAVRQYRAALEAMRPEQRRTASWMRASLRTSLEKSGDREGLAAERRTLRDELEKAVATAKSPKALPERLALAEALVQQRCDPAAGLALYQELAKELPDEPVIEHGIALALRLVGRCKDAVAKYEAMRERTRKRVGNTYKEPKPVHDIEFGLALAGAGESERAKRILEPALRELEGRVHSAWQGDATSIREIREALGMSPR